MVKDQQETESYISLDRRGRQRMHTVLYEEQQLKLNLAEAFDDYGALTES
jgi:hypothetical protein